MKDKMLKDKIVQITYDFSDSFSRCCTDGKNFTSYRNYAKL